jgi:transcriptional regulator GlxA family with amidase domain
VTKAVEILLFDDVELLDFAGPYEVFSVAGRRGGLEPYSVHTVAEANSPVRSRNGLVVQTDFDFGDAPEHVDYFVIPGGFGTRPLLARPGVLDWTRARAASASRAISICTGALVLGAAGLLDGVEATTHHQAFDELRQAAPRAHVVENRRWIDSGKVVTAAGVAAGIDVSLYLIAAELGHEVAMETARYIEYPWPSAVP